MVTKVLIVDDSQAMCRFLSQVLSGDPELKVVGCALDAYEARSMIKTLRPDVLTLDVEMPRMDGLTFLKNLMRLRPLPVVMLSSLTSAGAEVTLESLSIGAVDFMVKRHPGAGAEYDNYVNEIRSRVKAAGKTTLGRVTGKAEVDTSNPSYGTCFAIAQSLSPVSAQLNTVVGIGASTGGPEAVAEVLANMRLSKCCVVFSQHMPERFMSPFAQRLNGLTRFEVAIAQSGEPLLAGRCYVAPGDKHLKIQRDSAGLGVKIDAGPECSGHRPSVDVMFSSLAKSAPKSSVGLLLTGMGRDGATGMKALHEAGGLTIAQDEQSSAVWGMPGSAVSLGAAHAQVSLRSIGPTLGALLASG